MGSHTTYENCTMNREAMVTALTANSPKATSVVRPSLSECSLSRRMLKMKQGDLTFLAEFNAGETAGTIPKRPGSPGSPPGPHIRLQAPWARGCSELREQPGHSLRKHVPSTPSPEV